MRIAILATDNREHHRRYELTEPYFGPAIESVLQGLSSLQDLEIHVVSCTQQPMHSPKKLSANTWFHLLHVPKIGWLRTGYQGCVRAIRRKLQELRPDIVHGQGTERECALSAIFSGFPNVITLHGNMRKVARSVDARIGGYFWCAAVLERFTLPKSMGVLCNSAYTESLVRQVARRTWRVANAVRSEFFDTPLPAASITAKPILLNVGAISIHKRQIEILNIAERLHHEEHSFELQFIGAADAEDAYTAAFFHRLKSAESAGFARHIENHALADLIAAFDRASALIHFPSEEAFGLVVAEALARNLKVFASNIGGIPDIAAGVAGIELLPYADSTAIAASIAQWFRAGLPRPQLPSPKMRLRYHPLTIARQHMDIYREVAATKRVR